MPRLAERAPIVERRVPHANAGEPGLRPADRSERLTSSRVPVPERLRAEGARSIDIFERGGATASALNVPAAAPPRRPLQASHDLSTAFVRSQFHDSLEPGAPLWKMLLGRVPNPARARVALELFAREHVPLAAVREVADLVWAAGTTRDATYGEGLVTPREGARALVTLDRLAGAQARFMQRLLDSATSSAERAVLLKGLAARAAVLSSADFPRDMVKLARKIRGRSLAWLIAHTTGHGLTDRISFKQNFTMSCGPTVRLLAQAEIDPLFAISVSEERRRWGDVRSLQARLEFAILEHHGGRAVPRDDEVRARWGRAQSDEEGSWLADYINSAGAEAGIHYRFVYADAVMKHPKVLELIAKMVDEGRDVPIRIGDPTFGEDGHFEFIVDVATPPHSPRLWRVHDVMTGTTSWMADADLLGHGFTLNRVITHFYLPRDLRRLAPRVSRLSGLAP